MMRTSSILGLVACVLVSPAVRANDWPQWRGPNRDGVSAEKGLLKVWPKKGPELLWRFKDSGTGYTAPSVVGDKVYTMGSRKGVEQVIALDDKGAEMWSANIGPVFTFPTNQWSEGPNASPTVDGNLLFALGSQGDLVCVDLTTHAAVWRKNLPKDLGAEINPIGGGPPKMGWGFAWSPVVDGDHLIITPGGPKGLLAALDKKTGTLVWRSKEVPEQATYSSPLLAQIGGVRQVVQMTQKGVIGVDVKNGALLWYYKRDSAYPDVVCPTPLVKGDVVYATAGFLGGACDIFTVNNDGKKFTTKSIYSEKEIGNRQGGVVLVGGHVYGYHEERAWECQEFPKGEIKWSFRNQRVLGAGSVIAADGNLYCLAQDFRKMGVVALVEASPEKFKLKSKFVLPQRSMKRKLSGGVWTHPVLSNGRLYLRDQELIFCYKVK